jgi:hypothetical protein
VQWEITEIVEGESGDSAMEGIVEGGNSSKRLKMGD